MRVQKKEYPSKDQDQNFVNEFLKMIELLVHFVRCYFLWYLRKRKEYPYEDQDQDLRSEILKLIGLLVNFVPWQVLCVWFSVFCDPCCSCHYRLLGCYMLLILYWLSCE